MTALRAAVGLLTRFPVASAGPFGGAAAFGIVGAILGCAAALPVLVLGGAAPLAAGAAAVGIGAALSGALHLDGLADTADALAAPDPGRAEAARTDPRVGAAGAVAITMAVLLDASLIAAIVGIAGVVPAAAAVVLAFAGSRAAAAISAPLARGRIGGGSSSAAWFVARTDPPAALISIGVATAIAAVAAMALGSPVLVVGLAAGLVACIVAGEWLIRRRGGLDGDGIGAIVEITFGAILLANVMAFTATGLA